MVIESIEISKNVLWNKAEGARGCRVKKQMKMMKEKKKI
jgi:hypothetical protein